MYFLEEVSKERVCVSSFCTEQLSLSFHFCQPERTATLLHAYRLVEVPGNPSVFRRVPVAVAYDDSEIEAVSEMIAETEVTDRADIMPDAVSSSVSDEPVADASVGSQDFFCSHDMPHGSKIWKREVGSNRLTSKWVVNIKEEDDLYSDNE